MEIRMEPRHWQFFWAKVVKTENCWLWTAYKDKDGYGRFTINNGKVHYPFVAHRLTYEFFKGVIPDGLQLDHLCRNRSCVNPEHLEAVTVKENILRGFTGYHHNRPNSRKTHCVRGHPLSGDNLRQCQLKKGIRDCIMCGKIRMENRRQKQERRSPS